MASLTPLHPRRLAVILVGLAVALTACGRLGDSGTPPESTPPSHEIANFTLLDGTTGEPIEGFDPIGEDVAINPFALAPSVLALRANIDASFDGSVVFAIDGVDAHVTHRAPHVFLLPASGGALSITATPRNGNGSGASLGTSTTLGLTLLNAVSSSEVTRIALIDANADEPIAGFDPLPDGAVLDYDALGTDAISFQAFTSPSQVGSVLFELNGEQVAIENKLPYVIAGDNANGTDITPILPPLDPGAYVLTATPFPQRLAQGTPGTPLTRSFEIAAPEPVPNEGPVAADDAYTVATGATLTVDAPGVLVNDTDANGDALTATLVDAPANGTLTLNADGSFAYTHDGGASTSDAFTYTASDGELTSSTATVTFTIDEVAEPNAAPVANADAYDLLRGQSLTVGVPGVLANDTDPDGDGLTASVVDAPSHGDLTLNADGSFTYAHDGGTSTSDSFTYSAHDGTLSSSPATVSLTITTDTSLSIQRLALVNADTDAPIAAHDPLLDGATVDYRIIGTENVTVQAFTNPDKVGSVRFMLNGTDYSIENKLPYAMAGDSASGTDFEPILPPLADGVHTLTVTPYTEAHAQGDAGVAQTVSFEVISEDPEVNEAPVATNDAYSVATGATLTVDAPGVLANDTDANGDALTATLVDAPANGTLTLNADGSLTYTHDGGATTSDAFTYTASDGALTSNTATVTLTIDAAAEPNEAPVASDDGYAVGSGATLNVDAPGVLANDTDAEGDALTAHLVDGPTHGTLTLAADGSFTYTHDGGTASTDTFTYTAHDGALASNTATVTLTIATTAIERLVLVNADTDASVSGFDPLPDGAVVSYLDIGTQNVSIVAHTQPETVGSVLFTLDGQDVRIENQAPYAIAGDGASGTDVFPIDPPLADGLHTLTVTPFSGSSGGGEAGAPVTVTFEVVSDDPEVNDPPFAENDAYLAFTGATLTVDAPGVLANDFDPEGAPLTAALVDGPAHGTVTLNADGSFTYTHDGGTSTSDAFTYTASDGETTSNAATVSLSMDELASVSGFTLINADTNAPVAGFDPIPDGAVIDYAELGTQNLNVVAHTVPETVGSVLFTLNGEDAGIENEAPYALASDVNGVDFLALDPPLPTGTHTLSATPYAEPFAGGAAGASATVQFEVTTYGVAGCTPSPSQFDGRQISSLSCDQIKVADPFELSWDADEGGMADGDGTGHGFTMVLPASNGAGHLPFLVDAASGALTINSTSGLKFTTSDSQDNALGVGLGLPDKSLRVEATLLNPPAGTGGFEQAGIWFGISEDDYIKLALVSRPDGPVVEVLKEEAGASTGSSRVNVTLPMATLGLSLIADPSNATVTARFSVDGGAELTLHQFTNVPEAWFSRDAAGIDFNVGTRSYGGVFTSHRNGDGSLPYHFGDFAVVADDSTTPPPPPDEDTTVDFDPWRIENVDFPTALVWGPDRRLYAASATGAVHALTIDVDGKDLVDMQVIDTLGQRLALGIAVDPDSTPDDVILWVAHSNASQNAGEANSGTVTRLSGPDFATREDVITGLPRAIANHATNNIHFGPDGRLYLAQGGNTGAGASNDGGSEFLTRPEQPLSAAMLVADVKAPGFDGTCRSEIDPDGSQMDATGISATDVPCDVEVFASGLRNAYDFAFHSNGELYVTDNGLGVEGTFPALNPDDLSWTPGDGCEGMHEGSAERDAHNPGERTDLVLRMQQGGYYGHPNPSRGECVFFGGNPSGGADFPVPTSANEPQAYMDTAKYDVGRAPEPTWQEPMFALGEGKSANGVIEYAGDNFCGPLKGDLLITYYSVGDQIRRLQLSSDGTTVTADGTLVRSTGGTGGIDLGNPLPIAQDPLGRIYVGEFGGGGRIAVFDPIGPGCWQDDGVATGPVSLLDAGGTSFDDRLYLVAGKTSAGYQRSLHVYDAVADAWTTGPDLPAAYPAVEDPAVTLHDGQLYVFGGSTDPFTDSVTQAARFDPAAGTWTMLPDMPTARGGAVAEAIGDDIYVVGGRGATGASQASMDVFDTISGTWSSSGPAMATPRDNAGSAALDGKLYVFGGRTRLSTTLPNNDTLATSEVFDPATGAWTAAPSMNVGRRAFTATVVDGEAVAIGGEHSATNETFVATEAFDPATGTWTVLPDAPVGRHGAVAGRIGNGVYVATGGKQVGASFSNDIDVFRYR